MWTTVVCRIVELDEWSLCSPSALRAPICIDLSNLGDMC